MEEFVTERYLPSCCRSSYRGENGSRHDTPDGEEFCCLECGTEWIVEYGSGSPEEESE